MKEINSLPFSNLLGKIFLGLLFIAFLSCSNDSDSIENPEIQEIPNEPDENDEVLELPIIGETGKVLVYEKDKVDQGYILVNDAGDNRVYLMTKDAKIIYEWELQSGIGNDAELFDDGRLLVALQDENAVYDIGGYGGRVQLINADQSIDWDFLYSSEEVLSHHDVEMLPNGNVLILAWQKKDKEQATQAGYDGSPDVDLLLVESLIEVDPNTDDVVWEWHSWDHLIQDFDPSKDNYGDISLNPQLIDINYADDDRGDIMHANAISYDPITDLIYMSVNFYSEVWVIDHSTSTEEASTEKGGNYNKGGNLVYRFGNPEAYKNSLGNRLFFNNHHPNILNSVGGVTNLLIYMNGNDGAEQSTVMELAFSTDFSLEPNKNNEPPLIWEYTHPDLYSPIVSGAVRLPNNNTLITEGRYGFWEVDDQGEILWLFEGNSLFWRGYSYEKNHPGIQMLDLSLD